VTGAPLERRYHSSDGASWRQTVRLGRHSQNDGAPGGDNPGGEPARLVPAHLVADGLHQRRDVFLADDGTPDTAWRDGAPGGDGTPGDDRRTWRRRCLNDERT
jgi:hypothetical protein